MHEWLSGGVSPCQGEGRGFESRLVLFYCHFLSGLSHGYGQAFFFDRKLRYFPAKKNPSGQTENSLRRYFCTGYFLVYLYLFSLRYTMTSSQLPLITSGCNAPQHIKWYRSDHPHWYTVIFGTSSPSPSTKTWLRRVPYPLYFQSHRNPDTEHLPHNGTS